MKPSPGSASHRPEFSPVFLVPGFYNRAPVIVFSFTARPNPNNARCRYGLPHAIGSLKGPARAARTPCFKEEASMPTQLPLKARIPRDLLSGLVVFFVALPLCLGIATASGAPPISGLIAGAIAGLVVGILSGSQIIIAGPAAGLAASVLSQIDKLGGNYNAFLLTVVLCGVFQLLFAWLRAGLFANYFPTNVVRGLLAAIGIILVMKEVPPLIGYDGAPQGFSFQLTEGINIITALFNFNVRMGAAIIGVVCVVFILVWDNTPLKKKIPLPSALLAVLLGVGLNKLFLVTGSSLAVTGDHLINLPNILDNPKAAFRYPDFSQIKNPVVWSGALALAIVASLESMLNLEASERIDPLKRPIRPNRELFAQGVGNTLCGLLGGMPIASVIVRTKVNAEAGARSRVSAFTHGLLLALAVVLLPWLLKCIPLAALAAILVITGVKLASPELFIRMFREGWKQFLPFVVTVVAILGTDLMPGILTGLAVSFGFILKSNLRRGVQVVQEHHVGGEVYRFCLAEHVTFLNRASLNRKLEALPDGATVVIDATGSDYIDPDIVSLVTRFRDDHAPARNITVSLVGFRKHYEDVKDEVQHLDVSTFEVQSRLTPASVLGVLKDGNSRFVNNRRLNRDFARQISVTSAGQFPMAVVLGCMDSRAPTETVFDLGVGDIFSIRMAGNIAGERGLGSMEFACKLKGSKLIVVMGHTDCGAVTAACKLVAEKLDPVAATGLPHIGSIAGPISAAVQAEVAEFGGQPEVDAAFVDRVAERNVRHTIRYIVDTSSVLRDMIASGEIGIVGAMYCVKTGEVTFFEDGPKPVSTPV